MNIENKINNSSNKNKNGKEVYINFKNEFIKYLEQLNITKKDGENFYYLNYTNLNNINVRIKLTWHNIIKLKDKKILKKINDFRKIFVDSLINIILEIYANDCDKKKNLQYCDIQAIGSTSLISNYDINVSSYLVSAIIVEEFNLYFFDFWNDTSGEIFDTNLYGNSFFISTYISYNKILNKKYNFIINNKNKNKIIYYLPPKNIDNSVLNKIFNSQTEWLLIKIFLYKDTYLLEKNNNTYNILNKLEKNILSLLLSKNIVKYKKKYNTIKFLKNNVDIPENMYRNKLNNKYIESLKNIDKSQTYYQNNNEDNKLIDLIESISKSNFYGNETYFCLGTIYHVLGYIQKLGDFYMYDMYYIHSMIENYLDIFRYYEYINNSDYFILKSSKYIIRVYDAISRFHNKNIKNINNNMLKSMIEKKNIFNSIRTKFKNNSNINKLNNSKDKLIELKLINNTNNININVLLNNILKDITNTVDNYMMHVIINI